MAALSKFWAVVGTTLATAPLVLFWYLLDTETDRKDTPKAVRSNGTEENPGNSFIIRIRGYMGTTAFVFGFERFRRLYWVY